MVVLLFVLQSSAHPRFRFGFNLSIVYSLGAQVNPLNLKLLELVKDYFGGVGSISRSGHMYSYEVSSPFDLLLA